MDLLIYLAISSFGFLPLVTVTGQCYNRAPPCQLKCHCENQEYCQSYLNNTGCGYDSCQTPWRGHVCQTKNIVYGLTGKRNLGAPGFISNFWPRYAVDGNLSTEYSSVSVNRPFLWVNTGRRNVIKRLLVNTTGGSKGFEIDVSNSSNFLTKKKCYEDKSITGTSVYNIQCTAPVIGQYVRITLQSHKSLRIREFEVYGCADYWYGDNCDKVCNCQNQTEICDKNTGRCVSGSAPGYWNSDCQDQCPDGHYGQTCQFTCGRCKNNTICNKVDGGCRRGCESGFTGSTCSVTGQCYNRAPPCQLKCHCKNQEYCQSYLNNTSCGYDGCQTPWSGHVCQTRESKGFQIDVSNSTDFVRTKQCYEDKSITGTSVYNVQCTAPVIGQYVRIILPSNKSLRIREFAVYGCADYWYGDECDKVCNCRNQTEICNKYTGRCVSGCAPGYWNGDCQDAQTTDNSVVRAALGAAFGAIAIAIVVLAIVVVKRRYPNRFLLAGRKPREQKNLETETSSTELGVTGQERGECAEDNTKYVNTSSLNIQDTAILVRDLVSTLSQKLENINSLKEEYEALPTGLLESTIEASKPHNNKKCRYRKIIPYDHTRVVLDNIDDDPTTDFMNASFVRSYSKEKAFIASQGPTKANINEFWRMNWQFEVEKIVMLTNVYESGKQKVLQYWPNEDVVRFGDIAIKTAHIDQGVDVTVRTLIVSKNNDMRTVKQFHYREWPDHDVPRDTTGIIELKEKVDGTPTSLGGPVVVHCSAGVGRTGTYIAFNNIIEQLESETKVDIYQHVKELRHQRTQMVQTLEQYIFVHRAIKDASLCRCFSLTTEEIMATQFPFPSARVQDEFKILEKLRVSRNTDAYKAALDDTNRGKNRDVNSIQRDVNRIWLSGEVPGSNDYINAQFIPCVGGGTKVIVTQIPFGDTRVDFWRLVYQTKSTSLVLLDPDVQPNEKYWPSDDTPTTIEPFIVTLLSEVTSENVTLRTLSVKVSPNDPPHIVQQYNCDYWVKDQVIPDTVGGLINLRNWITSRQRLSECGPIIIHCRDSCDRSGLYCVIHCLLDRLESDNSVNVPLIINRIRQYCENAVSSTTQYGFCYQVLRAYLDTFNTYGNFN